MANINYVPNTDYIPGEVSRYKILRKIQELDSNEAYLETQNQRFIAQTNQDVWHTVSVGERNRLDIIANIYYKDPTMWWAIAMANEMISPFFVSEGTILRIPSINTLNSPREKILSR